MNYQSIRMSIHNINEDLAAYQMAHNLPLEGARESLWRVITSSTYPGTFCLQHVTFLNQTIERLEAVGL
tara:strand:+ start:377 stop:583 length:207 start_codon:yes stop_codon:yes gene_type:complete